MGSTNVQTPVYKTSLTQPAGGVFTPPERLAVVKIAAVTETITEGTAAVFDVVRSGVTTSSCAVEWIITNSGTAGLLPPLSGVALFGPGDLVVRLTLPSENAGGVQGNRSAKVTLESPVGCIIDHIEYYSDVLITDQLSATVSVSVAFPTSGVVEEFDTNFQTVQFLITKTGDPIACSVTWTRDGTINDADLEIPQPFGTATFGPSDSYVVVEYHILGDFDVEPTETLTLTLRTATNCSIVQSTATVTVVGAETPNVEVAVVGPTSISEGNAGNKTLTFRITRFGALANCSVTWAREGSIAASDLVVSNLSGTANFTTNSTVDLTWQLIGDILPEPNETLTVALKIATNCTISQGTATITIVSDDISTPSGWPYPQSPLYGRLNWNRAITRYGQTNDQWPCSEDASNRLLWVGADGNGFTGVARTNWRVSRIGSTIPGITGTSPALTGLTDLNMRMLEQADDPSPLPTSSKPQGVLAFNTDHIAVWYSFQGDAIGNYPGRTHLALSTDNGTTYALNRAEADYLFGSFSVDDDLIVWGVLQLGPGYASGPAMVDREYIYCYLGSGGQLRTDQWNLAHANPTIWLARVKWTGTGGSVANLSDRTKYQLLNGLSPSGVPTWGVLGDFTVGQIPVYVDPAGMALYFNVEWHSAINKFVAAYIHCKSLGTSTVIPHQGIAVAISDSPWDRNAWTMIGYDRDLDFHDATEEDMYMSIMAPNRWNDGTSMRIGVSTYVYPGAVPGDNLIVTSSALTQTAATSPQNSSPPVVTVVSGSPIVGSTLTCTTGSWNGTPTIAYEYQWRRGSLDLGGQNAATYLTVTADLGASMTCRVTATNGVGTATALSNAIVVTAAVTAPVNSGALPNVSGPTVFGSTLTCTTGGWTGTAPIAYFYQWRRNGLNITNATNSTYLTLAGDVGASISCWVTASNSAGNATALSNAIVVTTFAATVSVALVLPVAPTVTITEFNSNFQTVQFLITKTGDPIACSVTWVREGTISASDLETSQPSGTANFAANEFDKLIEYHVLGDVLDEPNETLTLRLVTATGCSIVTSSATVTVINDDTTTTLGSTPIRRVPNNKRIICMVAGGRDYTGANAKLGEISNLIYRCVYVRNFDFKTLVRGDLRTGAYTTNVNDHGTQGMIDHAKWQLRVLTLAQDRMIPVPPDALWWDPESYEDCVHLNVPANVVADGWSDSHPDDHAITTYYSTVRSIWRKEAVRWHKAVLTKMYDYAHNDFNKPNFEVGHYNIPSQNSPNFSIDATDTKGPLFDAGLLSWTGPPLYLSGLGTGSHVSKNTFLTNFTQSIVSGVKAAYGPNIKVLPVLWPRMTCPGTNTGNNFLLPRGQGTCNPPASVACHDWMGCWKGNASLGYPAGSYMTPPGWLGEQAKRCLDAGADGFFIWRAGEGDDGTSALWTARYQEIINVVNADGRFVKPT